MSGFDGLIAALATLVGLLIAEPLLLAIARILGLYAIVRERTCRVYVLFGKVIGELSEPGLYFLPFALGPSAFIVNWFGKCYVLDLRLDQEYLRSQPVNSEEGAPMGIGIWYEMQISNPVAYLFKNTDPRGSLARQCQQRHRPLPQQHAPRRDARNPPPHEPDRARRSQRESQAWGYSLGSIYIRKVHFRDVGMIRQIEEKVVNRLRQVTSAIRQDGANQVSIITSSAEKTAAVAFAQAAVIRPK